MKTGCVFGLAAIFIVAVTAQGENPNRKCLKNCICGTQTGPDGSCECKTCYEWLCSLLQCTDNCQTGYQKNALGCKTCECKSNPSDHGTSCNANHCEVEICKINCLCGLEIKDCCPTCRCKDCRRPSFRSNCADSVCTLQCPCGRAKGPDGCKICKCDECNKRPVYCPESCTKNLDPVCGNDGVTYSNECMMRDSLCRQGLTGEIMYPFIRHKGKCDDKTEPRDIEWECPSNCFKNLDPVCGKNGLTYDNECVMRETLCRQRFIRNVKILHMGACTGDIECPDDCPNKIEPICGTNGVTYDNECVMRRQICEQGLKGKVGIRRKGFCHANDGCSVGCPILQAPLCGSNNMTYPNLCVFRNLLCKQGLTGKVTVLHEDSCSD